MNANQCNPSGTTATARPGLWRRVANRLANCAGALIVLGLVALLEACGGGGEPTEPHVCYVDGQPKAAQACK